MAKVTYLCEVKCCTRMAENEILLRREKLRVCHAHSFVSLRSPEYRKWKALQHLYKMPVQFSDHVPIERKDGTDSQNKMTLRFVGHI